MNSIGCDPYISQDNEENSTQTLCFKCKQLLTKEEKEAIKNCQPKIIHQNTLLKSVVNVNEQELSPTKKQRLQKAVEAEKDNSPGFSDISDDSAPTLEKQEQVILNLFEFFNELFRCLKSKLTINKHLHFLLIKNESSEIF